MTAGKRTFAPVMPIARRMMDRLVAVAVEYDLDRALPAAQSNDGTARRSRVDHDARRQGGADQQA